MIIVYITGNPTRVFLKLTLIFVSMRRSQWTSLCSADKIIKNALHEKVFIMQSHSYYSSNYKTIWTGLCTLYIHSDVKLYIFSKNCFLWVVLQYIYFERFTRKLSIALSLPWWPLQPTAHLPYFSLRLINRLINFPLYIVLSFKWNVCPGRDTAAGGVWTILYGVWRLFSRGRVSCQAAVELSVPPSSARVPAGVGRHPPEAAGVPASAQQRQARRCGAARCPCSPAKTGGETAVRGHGGPEEGDTGSAEETEGAEDPEGAGVCVL